MEKMCFGGKKAEMKLAKITAKQLSDVNAKINIEIGFWLQISILQYANSQFILIFPCNIYIVVGVWCFRTNQASAVKICTVETTLEKIERK